MRRVSGKKQPAVLHWFDNIAAHAGDAFLQNRPLREFPAFGTQPRLEFLPDTLIAPGIDVFVRIALQIEATDLRRPHAVQGESAIMVCVDQFLRRWRRIGEDAEPSEGILSLVLSEDPCRNARPANTVGAVASGDEVADEFVIAAIFPIAYLWLSVVKVMNADVFHLKVHVAAGRDPSIVEVFENFVLSVDRDSLAAGEFLKINPVASALEAQFDAVVDQAFTLHPLADTHLGEQVHGSLLQHARADAFLHILAAAIFDYD